MSDSNPQHKRRLLLVGWDSADWKLIHPLIDQGLLPGVQQLVEEGVSGNLTTLEPQLSPMLWTSIATGKMAYHHGVQGFTEVDPVSGRVVPVSAATRQCKTLWEMLTERGLKSHVVGWFATQGERDLNGCVVSNMFGHLKNLDPNLDPSHWPEPMPGTYWPEELGEEMNAFRVSPYEIDPDTVLRRFVPDAPQVDQQRDRRLWMLAEKLSEAYSVQSAATYLMEKESDWDFMAVYFRALDEIKHIFMHYHPPRMDGIPESDFERYREVVTMTYRAHDLMLQRLVELAGPDAAVMLVSDHGFHSDHLRPKFTPRVPAGITVWHRPQGVIAARGAGFHQDELIYGARLLDLCPTVLHYFGLPVGDDMEGRVLTEAFVDGKAVATIPSWESPDDTRRSRGSLSTEESKALLEQFVALGYIDAISDDPDEAAAATHRENQWNLARACLYGGRFEKALPLLEDIYWLYPERPDYAQTLAGCQLKLGLLNEAEETSEACLEGFGHTEVAHLIRANIALEKKRYPTALEHLEAVQATRPRNLQLLNMLSQSLLKMRRWEDCRQVCRTTLEIDPNNPAANLDLARCALHQEEYDRAVECALEAIGYQYGNPRGHFLLGVALGKKEDWESAATAFRNVLALSPGFLPAYRYLARIMRQLGDLESADGALVKLRLERKRISIERRKRMERLRSESVQRMAERKRRRDDGRQLEIEQKRAGHANGEPSGERGGRGGLEPDQEFVIVSGLPRSGTSLMMQMLQAAGMELMTDGHRLPDEDNPKGYFEWEGIKKLSRDPLLIERTHGKVTKVVSALLPHLPPKHRYKIVFMTRPVEEVVTSQWKMLKRGGVDPKSERAHLERTQAAHAAQMLEVLRRNPRSEVLEVDYPGLVRDPDSAIARLRPFLGLPEKATEMMRACVKPELYRNRRMQQDG